MSVCRNVYELFSVKEWRDLELGVGVIQSHWKWRHSIDHTTFYWSAIVNIALFDTVLGLLDVENIVTLKSGLEVTEVYSNWYRSKDWVRFPICLP